MFNFIEDEPEEVEGEVVTTDDEDEEISDGDT